MPQNTQDSKSSKNKPMTETGAKDGAQNSARDAKRPDKGSADNKSGSPAGSQNHGEKKTTP